MKVTDPSGTTWRISRRWVPWRRRSKGWFAKTMDGTPSMPVVGGDDPVSAVISAVILVILLPFLVVALVVGLIALIELAVLLAVLPVALLARMLTGRHWYVEMRRGFRPYWEVDAGSWRASGERILEIAQAVERGHLPHPTLRQP